MRTTIDGAGRVVVPKALRDAMRLTPGQQVDISLMDGRLEIDVPALAVTVRRRRRIDVAEPDEPLPPLTSDVVREVLEETRR